MNYFVIQVMTGGEERYLKLAQRVLDASSSTSADLFEAAGPPPHTSLPEEAGRLLWPRRRLTLIKRGVRKQVLAPIFPGYLFYEAEAVSAGAFHLLKRPSGFVKFLKDNHNIQPLAGDDRELLLHFISFGEIVDRSKVYLDANRRVRVASGPLKGLEGRIVKVDKRKGRAKVRLSLYENSFLIDFGFDLLSSAEKHEEGKA